MTPITTIFFDLGGVCLTNARGTESRQQAAKTFSIEFEEMVKRHRQRFEAWERNEISFATYLSEVIFHTPRQFSRQEFVGFMQAQSQPLRKTLQLVQALQQSGRYRLATLNNENFALNEYRIEYFALWELFHAFLSSCDRGVRIPQPRISEMALHIMAVHPEQAVFIDDRLENVQAAVFLGMQAIQFQNADQFREQFQGLTLL